MMATRASDCWVKEGRVHLGTVIAKGRIWEKRPALEIPVRASRTIDAAIYDATMPKRLDTLTHLSEPFDAERDRRSHIGSLFWLLAT